MRKVIVTYASAGAGHFKAAQAVYDYLKKERPDLDTRLIDVLSKSNIFFRLSYTFGYPLLVRYLQWLWGILFWLTFIKFLRPFTRGVISFGNGLSAAGFIRFLIKENPDFIVSTHFLPSEIAAGLKKASKISSFVMTVITDFGVHPFWLSAGTDLYLAACDATKELLIGEGVSPQNIKCSGIPVNTVFLERRNKEDLLKKMGLKGDKFNVLIVTGSFGIGPIEKIIGLLREDAQILVVCARNHKLYKKLKAANFQNCRIFGFVDNIHELMSVSDCIITKPGGLSTYESLVMNLVPVFISPIPGQEKENIRVLSGRGIGVYPKKIDLLRAAVLGLKQDPEKSAKLKQDIAGFVRPYAVKDISDVIC